jgi:hypothetical protein
MQSWQNVGVYVLVVTKNSIEECATLFQFAINNSPVPVVGLSITPSICLGGVLYYVHQAKGRDDSELAAQLRQT